MDSLVIKSFVFNKMVLAILLGACFLVTGLDIYIDASRDNLIRTAAIEIAESNLVILNHLADQGMNIKDLHSSLNPFSKKVIDLEVNLLNENSLSTPFQQDAFRALSNNRNEIFFRLEKKPNLILHYAVNTSWGFLELIIPMDSLGFVAKEQARVAFWVFLILGIVSVLLLSGFLGYWRLSTSRLLATKEKALNYQKKLTESYERFFPKEFLNLLGKKSILDIHLGDRSQRDMAVLFSDIQNFTGMTENKTPEESFNILNEYLHYAAPIIRNHNGFIDKYFGDAIMALFDKADNALLSILNVMKELQKRVKSQSSSSEIIEEIRVGLHFGPLMVGTLGEEMRMDATVISDIVNAASRLEALNKVYQTHIIVSEQFLNCLQNKEKFKIRFIDHIYLAGKQEASRIFEIFDMDGPSIIQKKEQIRSDFDKGFKSYENKKFEEALGFFENCLKIFPEDAATNIFITRLKKLITNPPAEDWSPIFRFSQKDAI